MAKRRTKTPSELELEKVAMGVYEIVYSPDDNGYWVSLWWDNDRDSPVFASRAKALAWARKQGGTREIASR